jgi:O-antigen/teichoic acid export membrane protein
VVLKQATAQEPALAEGDTIRRNTALSVVALIGPALLSLGLTVYLVRALGPHAYGEFALALALGLILLLPSDFGLTQSAARFIAEHRTNAVAVADMLSDALRLKLFAGIALGAGMWAAAGRIAEAYGQPSLIWPLRGIVLAVFAQGMMAFWNTAFVALRRVSLNLQVVLVESAAEVLASIALVALGTGAIGAAFGRAFGYGFGALAALVLTYRLLGRNAVAVRRSSRGHATRIAHYAGAMWVIDGAYSALVSVSPLVIGALLSAEQVGLFQAPFKLAYALTYVGLAFANGVAPRMSRASERPDSGGFVVAVRSLIILQAAFAIPIAVWADPITHLVLGDDYGGSVEVLRTLAFFVFVAGFAPLFALSVNYLGVAGKRIPIAIGAVLVIVAVDLALIPQIGVIGAAIGEDVAIIFYTGGHLWICRRMVGLSLEPLAKTLLRTSVAGAAMAAFLLALGTSGLTLPVLIAGGAAALAVFAGTLVLLGEFSHAELGAAGTALTQFSRRRD